LTFQSTVIHCPASRVQLSNLHISNKMSEGDTYAPQSPDLSAYQSAQPSIQSPSYSYGHPPSHHQSHFQSPYFPAQAGQPLTAYPSNHSASPYQQHYQQQGFGHSTPNNMPRRSRADAGFDDEGMAGPSSSANSKLPKKQRGEEEFTRPTPGSLEGIEVKTKFPVARIKRIMQADDDVGKVAQVTPTAVCKFKTSTQSNCTNNKLKQPKH
jgi:hypothetical protein